MLPPSFTRHTVSVESLIDEGRYGPTYEPSRSVPGVWVEVGTKTAVTSVGEEIASAARVWLDLGAASIAPGDRVTLPNGHTGFAISVDEFISPGSLSHVEVAVT